MIFMSPPQFAKRVNLPEDMIRYLAKQGKLPHIKPGKSHIQIDVESAEEVLRQMAADMAETLEMVVPISVVARQKVKRCGRPPDKIRLKGGTV